jgi:hypothetical protein
LPCAYTGTETSLSPSAWFISFCLYHYTNTPESSSSNFCSYQKDKRAKPGNLKNSTLFRKSGSLNKQVLSVFSCSKLRIQFSLTMQYPEAPHSESKINTGQQTESATPHCWFLYRDGSFMAITFQQQWSMELGASLHCRLFSPVSRVTSSSSCLFSLKISEADTFLRVAIAVKQIPLLRNKFGCFGDLECTESGCQALKLLCGDDPSFRPSVTCQRLNRASDFHEIRSSQNVEQLCVPRTSV